MLAELHPKQAEGGTTGGESHRRPPMHLIVDPKEGENDGVPFGVALVQEAQDRQAAEEEGDAPEGARVLRAVIEGGAGDVVELDLRAKPAAALHGGVHGRGGATQAGIRLGGHGVLASRRTRGNDRLSLIHI